MKNILLWITLLCLPLQVYSGDDDAPATIIHADLVTATTLEDMFGEAELVTQCATHMTNFIENMDKLVGDYKKLLAKQNITISKQAEIHFRETMTTQIMISFLKNPDNSIQLCLT